MKIISDLNLNNNQIINSCLENYKGNFSSSLKTGKLWFDTENNCIKIVNTNNEIISIIGENNITNLKEVLPKYYLSDYELDFNKAYNQGVYYGVTIGGESYLNKPENLNNNSTVTLFVLINLQEQIVQLIFDNSLDLIYFRTGFKLEENYQFNKWIELTTSNHIHTELPNLSITDEINSTSTTTGALTVAGGVGIKGALNADSISGAIWNDYAEYRETVHQIEPGHCVCEKGDGKVCPSTKRLQKLPMIVSDTFGFSIGKINETDVPIAVCGRVLVFTDKPLKTFKVGDWVCSGKNGKVSKMNFFERLFFADRRVGIVSSFPSQETWGSGNVSTKDRIWIRI